MLPVVQTALCRKNYQLRVMRSLIISGSLQRHALSTIQDLVVRKFSVGIDLFPTALQAKQRHIFYALPHNWFHWMMKIWNFWVWDFYFRLNQSLRQPLLNRMEQNVPVFWCNACWTGKTDVVRAWIWLRIRIRRWNGAMKNFWSPLVMHVTKLANGYRQYAAILSWSVSHRWFPMIVLNASLNLLIVANFYDLICTPQHTTQPVTLLTELIIFLDLLFF